MLAVNQWKINDFFSHRKWVLSGCLACFPCTSRIGYTSIILDGFTSNGYSTHLTIAVERQNNQRFSSRQISLERSKSIMPQVWTWKFLLSWGNLIWWTIFEFLLYAASCARHWGNENKWDIVLALEKSQMPMGEDLHINSNDNINDVNYTES